MFCHQLHGAQASIGHLGTFACPACRVVLMFQLCYRPFEQHEHNGQRNPSTYWISIDQRIINAGSRQSASGGADTPATLNRLSTAPRQALPSHTHRVLRKPPAFRSHSPSLKAASRCKLCHIRCQASKPSTDSPTSIDVSPEVGKGKKLLIIGGTGRVGSSTAASLVQTHPNLTIILGTRGQEGYDAAVKNRPSLEGLEHRVLDRNNLQSILSAMEGCDMVLHTAGPFQRKKECLVLEAAIQAKIPYLGRLHMRSMQA